MGAKQKFSSMDVGAMVAALRRKLLKNQVANIYDLHGSKAFLLRLKNREKESKAAATEFANVVLEPGARFHVTKFDREKASVPSSACMKLRKHLRNLRVTAIEQVGLDRVILFRFEGANGQKLHILLELFVRGSLVLCDEEMRVLFRSVTYEFATNHVPVGGVYKLDQAAMTALVNPKIAKNPAHAVRPCAQKITDFCREIVAKQENLLRQEDGDPAGAPQEGAKNKEDAASSTGAGVASKVSGGGGGKNNKSGNNKNAGSTTAGSGRRNKQKKKGSSVKLEQVVLQCMYCVHPSLCQYSLRSVGLDPAMELKEALSSSGAEEVGEKLRAAIVRCLALMRKVHDEPSGVEAAVDSPSNPLIREIDALLADEALEQTGAEADGMVCGGYILAVRASPPSTAAAQSNYKDQDVAVAASSEKCESPQLTYVEFSPLKSLLRVPPTSIGNAKNSEAQILSDFGDFGEAVDQFFSVLEIQKLDEAKQNKQTKVLSKVERIRQDHEERIRKMEQIQDDAVLKARLLEENLELVDQCILMLNSRGRIDWQALWQEIKLQQNLGHPLAQHIHGLQFEKNQFVILLEDTITETAEEGGQGPPGSSGTIANDGSEIGSDDSDDDLAALFSDDENKKADKDGSPKDKSAKSKNRQTTTQTQRQDLPMVTLTIDLSVTAYGNVSKLHSQRKATKNKNEKTAAATGRVVKQAEKKAQQDVKKIEREHKVQNLRQVRQLTWFESKFNWFVSSEGYLCVQGRDATTQELLVKRYMDAENDVVVGCDKADNAMLVLVKGKGERNSQVCGKQVIFPPLTLQEATVLCLSQSSAWAKKDLLPCWWVYGEQIKITDLEISSRIVYYDVKGEKRLLPPTKLEMGYGLFFELADGFGGRHAGERKVRSLEEGDVDVAGVDVESVVEGVASRGYDMLSKVTEDEEEIADEMNSDVAEEQEEEVEGSTGDRGVLGEAEREQVSEKTVGGASCQAADEVEGAETKNVKETLLPRDDEDESSRNAADHLKQDLLVENEMDAELANEQDGEYSFQPAERVGHKKKLTKKERELAKKGIANPATAATERTISAATKSEEGTTKSDDGSCSSPEKSVDHKPLGAPTLSQSSSGGKKKEKQAAPKPVPRGQKAKLKKMAKYADQDEEDNAVRMQLLGAKEKTRINKQKHAVGVAAGEQEDDTGDSPKNGAHDELHSGGATGEMLTGGNKGGAGNKGTFKGSSKGKGKQGTKEQNKYQPPPKTREQLEQERQQIQDAIRKASPTSWDQLFTGRPFLDDGILRAVPVCAPFSAIKNCWFKVRLVPGVSTMKKGRLNALAQNLFFDDKNVADVLLEAKNYATLQTSGGTTGAGAGVAGAEPEAEAEHPTATVAEQPTATVAEPRAVVQGWKELMHGIPDMEIMNALISNAQIQAAGVQKIQQQMKKTKVVIAKGGTKGKQMSDKMLKSLYSM